MTNLQLHSKREPQLALPSSVAEANSGVLYTGMLKGYYVPNTNYYNVLPIDVEIAKIRVQFLVKSWSMIP